MTQKTEPFKLNLILLGRKAFKDNDWSSYGRE